MPTTLPLPSQDFLTFLRPWVTYFIIYLYIYRILYRNDKVRWVRGNLFLDLYCNSEYIHSRHIVQKWKWMEIPLSRASRKFPVVKTRKEKNLWFDHGDNSILSVWVLVDEQDLNFFNSQKLRFL